MISPRDLPGLRQDLVDWYGTDEAANRFADLAPSTLPDAVQLTARHRQTVRVAGLYFVNSDMTDLAVTIGRGLSTFALTRDDLPEDHGLLVWGHRPEQSERTDIVGHPIAVTWSAVRNHIEVTLYDHVPTAEPVFQRTLRRLWGKTSPALAHLWETILRADGRERPWSVLEDAEDSYQLARTLLATWLLIRQPADSRKALHEVEEVPAPRSSQKQILRGGGDPTRTVRYVTLRQSLRPLEGESSEGGGGHVRKLYKHRWFVSPHRRTYPDSDHPTGKSRRWVGPYLVVPAGCEDAPILGGERVNVLRR